MRVRSFEGINVENIENVEFLRYTEVLTSDGAVYNVSYWGDKIMELTSCVELDDDFFEAFFNNIVTTMAE